MHHLGLAGRILSLRLSLLDAVMSSLQHSIETLQKLVRHPSVSSTSNSAASETASGALANLGFDVEKTTYLAPEA
jgi:acetylornithine deacetylase/succinyl-diaminopimelate desuccinylase-like protein